MLEPLGLAGDNSRVMQWLVLSRDSLQGLAVGLQPASTKPNERTSFPLPSNGQAKRPPGGSTATSVYNSIRVAQATPGCK